MNAVEISRSALDVEWQRMQVISQNLANIQTSRTATGETYRPMRLVSGPRGGFADSLRTAEARSVEVLGIEAETGGVRRVHDPRHPHADAEGFVTYPQIDHASEMALMVQTERVYEANLTALSLAQQMYSRALELGK